MGYRMDKSELQFIDTLVADKLEDIENNLEGLDYAPEKVELLEALITVLEFQAKYMPKLNPDLLEEIQEDIEEFKAELQVVLEEVEV